MNSPCKAEVLNYLISTKEFRVLPTPIWRQVQSNAELSIESRFLWTVLWELCSLQPNFEKPLTWGFLSKRVGKSESTIRRWARSLQKFGYLEIRNVYAEQGGQLPSLFRIGVPTEVAKSAVKDFPDRRKKEVVQSSGVETKSAEQTGEPDTSAGYQNVTPSSDQVSGMNGACAERTPDIKQHAGVCDSNSAHHADSADNVLKIGAENSSTRPTSRLAERLNAIGKGSKRSYSERSEQKRSDVPDQNDRFSKELLEIRQRAAGMRISDFKLPEGEGEKGGVTSALTLVSKFATQDNNPSKQENNRTASIRSVVRRALAVKLGIRQDLEKLVDEFVVSIEKGAFKKFDLVKAINIGVKLVREGRWAAPRFVG